MTYYEPESNADIYVSLCGILVIAILVIIFMISGCHLHNAQTTVESTTVKKKHDDPCKLRMRKVGRHCAIVISSCKDKRVQAELIAIYVTNTSDGGRSAARETAAFLSEYFGTIPPMTLVAMDESSQAWFYLFAIPHRQK